MKILVINSGSSSIKYQLFRTADWAVCAAGTLSRIGEAEGSFAFSWMDSSARRQTGSEAAHIKNHNDGLTRIMALLRETGALAGEGDLSAIGHRVVHGGESFSAPTLIDGQVIEAIRAMIPLAPLHNPANLEGILVARELFPNVPQVAVFDTAFHQSMPPAAYRYAIPEAIYREHRVRRYGFHGSSHRYVARRAAEYLGKAPEETNLITLHLGNGASATAVRDGRSVDTSMGMTPLEGLVMGSRSGDIDPAIIFYLCREPGYRIEEVDRLLNKESGLLGLTGVNDMREIHRLAEGGDGNARLAREIFALRLKKYLGAYYAELGRVDAIVFTGGIGENDTWTRAQTCAGLEPMGIVLDAQANAAASREERAISTPDSGVAVLVVPTDEELEIARQAWEAVQGGATH